MVRHDLRVLVPCIVSGNGMRNPTFIQFNELSNFSEYKLLKKEVNGMFVWG